MQLSDNTPQDQALTAILLGANNGQALLHAVIVGIGVVVQSDALLQHSLNSGQLIQILPEWELPGRSIHIVRLPEARPSAKLRSFVDFVVSKLS